MHLLSLPEKVLIGIVHHLQLTDLIPLGDSNSKLRDLIYKRPEIWTSDFLFPIGDERITDKFILRLLPRITRHNGVLELRIVDLPLTWMGYLMIFDQFAHSVQTMDIRTTAEELSRLAHHLTIFAGNLAMLQLNNNIPITFRQYAFDDEDEYSSALVASNYVGQRSLHNLNNQFAGMILDDPPFERLHDLRIVIVNEEDPYAENAAIRQLELLASFLSGRRIKINGKFSVMNPRSPIPTAAIHYSSSSKRYRENDHHASGNNKLPRHDSPFYQRQEQQQQPQHETQQQQYNISYRSYA